MSARERISAALRASRSGVLVGYVTDDGDSGRLPLDGALLLLGAEPHRGELRAGADELTLVLEANGARFERRRVAA